MDIDSIKTDISKRKNALLSKKEENRIRKDDINDKVALQKELDDKMEVVGKSIEFVEKVASGRRSKIKDDIESIITEALKLIYGSHYSIALEYGIKNNRTSAEFKVIKETEIGTVIRGQGGFGLSVADTICVPLKLLVLMRSSVNSGCSPVLMIDEGFKHMDENRISSVGRFLSEISKRLGIQIIMCSHHGEMEEFAESVHEVVDDNGIARVTRLK